MDDDWEAHMDEPDAWEGFYVGMLVGAVLMGFLLTFLGSALWFEIKPKAHEVEVKQ